MGTTAFSEEGIDRGPEHRVADGTKVAFPGEREEGGAGDGRGQLAGRGKEWVAAARGHEHGDVNGAQPRGIDGPAALEHAPEDTVEGDGVEPG